MNSATLTDICETLYFPNNPKITCEKTKQQYRFAMKDFGDALGHAAMPSDLCDDNLVAMITWMRSQRVNGKARFSAKTINERVGRVRALQKWMFFKGMVTVHPTIGRIPEPKRNPLAWTHEELDKLLTACRQASGDIGGIPACSWWVAIHFAMWDSGERIGALREAEWEHVDWSGWLCLPAEIRKGKRQDRTYKLSPETMAALETIRYPRRRLIWPWDMHPNYLWPYYKKLRRRAGLPTDSKSSFHRMRRSVATWFEVAGGNATELLGHSDRRVTRDSYLDKRFIGQPQAIDKLFRLEPPRDSSRPPGT